MKKVYLLGWAMIIIVVITSSIATNAMNQGGGYYYQIDPWDYTTCEADDLIKGQLLGFMDEPYIEAQIKKCDDSNFSSGGYFEVRTNDEVVANSSHFDPGVNTMQTFFDPVGSGFPGRNTYEMYLYSDNDPGIPKIVCCIDAWPVYPGDEADLVIDHLEVTNNDTGAILNPGDYVPDGTSITFKVYIRNNGGTDAEDFYLEYFDNGVYQDDDFEGSTVLANGGSIEDESDGQTVSGLGQHTLSVNLDTTNVIPEIDEGNNSATFILNVGEIPPLPGNTGMWLPYGPQEGPVRVNRTGLQYKDFYDAAGLPTIEQANCAGVTTAYCLGSGGEYHDYQDIFSFPRAAIDFALDYGSPILAAQSGIVTIASLDECTVAISHDDGSGTAYYLHVSAIYVSMDQHVERGQHIANVGDDCNPYGSGAHLHFALWQNGQEIVSHFADSSAQAHGGIVRPSRVGFVEFRYPADGGLVSNYQTGSPGSYFTLNGTRFQANANVMISVNGLQMGSVTTDENGNYEFILSTVNADPGSYFTTAQVGQIAVTTPFALDLNSEYRPQEGSGVIMEIPPGIAFTYSTYLPLIRHE